jgi:hypothetical protein
MRLISWINPCGSATGTKSAKFETKFNSAQDVAQYLNKTVGPFLPLV